jgi:AraC family transcriptional regulator
MKYIILFAVLVVVGFTLSLLFRLGAFHAVTVAIGDQGPLRVIYKVHIGAYHKIVPVIEEVEKWAKANGEPCRISFGEYIDDPAISVEDRMHSNGGCIVEKAWPQAVGPTDESAGGTPPGSAGRLPPDFIYREIPSRTYVKAEFDGAPSIGPIKVYPRVKKFMKEKNLTPDGPVIETYEIMPGDKVVTRYLFPAKPI